MSYEKYEVRVYGDRVEWYQDDQLHRVNGPAEEWADGTKFWYYEGQSLTVYFFKKKWQEKVHQTQDNDCTGKVVEIEGKKYKLVEA